MVHFIPLYIVLEHSHDLVDIVIVDEHVELLRKDRPVLDQLRRWNDLSTYAYVHDLLVESKS